MRQLIAIFTRSGGILVFLILEIICLSLVVTFNKDQREIYHNSKSIMSDSMTHGWSEITQYWNLSAVNDSLSGVIAELKQQKDEAKFLKTIQQDSAKYTTEDFEQQYTYTSAKVISNTINLPNNFLTLDRGIRDGINTRMGVFDNQGIVGIVINSNTRYSKVMSILHRDSKISAKIARLNALETLVWTSIGNPRIIEYLVFSCILVLQSNSRRHQSRPEAPQGVPQGVPDHLEVIPKVALNNPSCDSVGDGDHINRGLP